MHAVAYVCVPAVLHHRTGALVGRALGRAWRKLGRVKSVRDRTLHPHLPRSASWGCSPGSGKIRGTPLSAGVDALGLVPCW